MTDDVEDCKCKLSQSQCSRSVVTMESKNIRRRNAVIIGNSRSCSLEQRGLKNGFKEIPNSRSRSIEQWSQRNTAIGNCRSCSVEQCSCNWRESKKYRIWKLRQLQQMRLRWGGLGAGVEQAYEYEYAYGIWQWQFFWLIFHVLTTSRKR
jgi:hypothetical protein